MPAQSNALLPHSVGHMGNLIRYGRTIQKANSGEMRDSLGVIDSLYHFILIVSGCAN